MPFDATHSGTDEFQFINPSDLSSPFTATTGQFALSQALLSRDINSSDLTEAQSELLSDYAGLLETASTAEIETSTQTATKNGKATVIVAESFTVSSKSNFLNFLFAIRRWQAKMLIIQESNLLIVSAFLVRFGCEDVS